MEEIWKPIVGYEGLYEVSSIGRVKRVAHSYISKRGITEWLSERVFKNHTYPNGYEYVTLSKGTVTHNCSIHRLVAIAFIPNPHDLPVVDHINTDKTDNRVCNLRWCTPAMNSRNPISYKRQFTSHGTAVDMFSLTGEYIRSFISISQAAREVGGSFSAISKCVTGSSKSSCGYRWKYKDENSRYKYHSRSCTRG